MNVNMDNTGEVSERPHKTSPSVRPSTCRSMIPQSSNDLEFTIKMLQKLRVIPARYVFFAFVRRLTLCTTGYC